MNKEINPGSFKFGLSQNALKILYDAYKEYIIAFAIIFVCLILFVKIIIPQIQDLFLINNQSKVLSEKIRVLKSNMIFLSSVNDDDLNSKLQVTSAALPSEKDFAAVLNAIQIASAKAGVMLGDFEFKVGELSTPSAKISTQPGMEIILTVSGGVEGSRRFITQLSKTLPLSQVSSLQTSGNLAVITTVFNYKPFSPTAFNFGSQLKALSKSDLSLLDKISSW